MTGFTKGPWEVRGNLEIHSSDGLVVQISPSFARGRAARDLDKADARLIAAAPDLYEALDAANKALAHHGIAPAVFRQSEAALAKARGE